MVWTIRGAFELPKDAESSSVVSTRIWMSSPKTSQSSASHADAGEVMICGWREKETPISFVDELGAHGGPGPNETSGFVILPPDAPRCPEDETPPKVLRDLAVTWLECRQRVTDRLPRPVQPDRNFLRVATYNVHGCVGLDGRLSPARIARVLLSLDADIVALQELDVGRSRSQAVDQAQIIADLLEMKMHFGAAIDVTGERYGNAILSRWPMELRRAELLSPGHGRSEPRGARLGHRDLGDEQVEIISTHLGLTQADRNQQLES